MNLNNDSQQEPKPGIRRFSEWLDKVGVSRVSGWRWRKLGWIQTVNISGVPYIEDSEIAAFIERARKGEYAKEHHAVD